MVTTITDSASISLYFDVPHKEAMSLQAIARAAIAWDGLIKELCSVVDPSIEIEVDFLSGTVGSRSLNSIIRASKRVAEKHPWTAGSLAALTGVFLLAPATHVADDLTSHLAKEWFNHEDDVLSHNDVERIARRAVELQRDNDARILRREIYNAGESDSRVKGIGAVPKIERPPPALIIPRARFDEFSSPVEAEKPIETRTITQEFQKVLVVRPYSKAEERRWKFEDARGEFSATMRDPIFLEALRYNKTGLDVGEGVPMVVDLKVREELIGGEWYPKEYDVIRVRKPNVDLQGSLQFAPDKPDEPDS